MSKNTKIVLSLLALVLVLAVVPMILKPSAEFGGSDDAGAQMVEEIQEGYEPWATPVLENAIGGELPGEIESLMFCVQTGIGVGVLGFGFGYFVARKKFGGDKEKRA